ncbi:hypothetical protein Sango_2938500 [Sesamum angolense]|uniref:Uncharacterized protein n=1 Tax=Sesamum angolense TaxID=2727404 RepID=A0AAE1T550_9LAMI|nr:hypothetical protein Sango_2938500 [Sesamum angolense]
MEEAQNSDSPPPKSFKTSYAKVIQQPAVALFQHVPVRARRKFQDDAMRLIGSDSSYKANQWIRLPALPVHLFEKNALFTLATKIGKPLRMDEPTADLSRPVARVCVEIDVKSPKVQAVYLQIEGKNL